MEAPEKHFLHATSYHASALASPTRRISKIDDLQHVGSKTPSLRASTRSTSLIITIIVFIVIIAATVAIRRALRRRSVRT
ncbi:hypothetical protein K437DRAFT_253732 [Tilletiaria anomala UBC 951]|uniref:Uncharacterized protein n=1 Tax=Tilletiaria anomala (strain ATCC 24038 / CBS 436.72 / UBC 951) TaxID=1037660 RepID=A0A066WJS2_TILAU|nr:uncharacterized protein K437DRAFT_253732 [Tilletiaria anomala UBC 951]KDN52803.1 hypothetical protein K437DRAFT_253732 [Tilletiaria anomala UBC 951]